MGSTKEKRFVRPRKEGELWGTKMKNANARTWRVACSSPNLPERWRDGNFRGELTFIEGHTREHGKVTKMRFVDTWATLQRLGMSREPSEPRVGGLGASPLLGNKVCTRISLSGRTREGTGSGSKNCRGACLTEARIALPGGRKDPNG